MAGAIRGDWKCFDCGAWGEYGAEGRAHERLRGHEVQYEEGITVVSERNGVPRWGYSRLGGGLFSGEPVGRGGRRMLG